MTEDKRRFNGEGERIAVEEPPVAEPLRFRIVPLNKWVLIKKVRREERRTAEGVIVPGGGRSNRGQVIAVAEGLPLKPGALVVYTNFPQKCEDIEELTQDRDLEMCRYEEIWARIDVEEPGIEAS